MAMDKVINLSKGKTICLTKTAVESGEALKRVKCGLAWGQIVREQRIFVKGEEPGFFGKLFGKKATEDHYETKVLGKKEVDLDASICVYDENKNLIDTVYFSNKVSFDGSMKTLGDDTTGVNKKGEGKDNETLIIDLHKVSERVKYLVIILNSYRHDKFDELPYARMRIYDDNKVFADYKIDNNPEFAGKEALVLGVFKRNSKNPGLWEFEASGVATTERSIPEIARGSAKNAIK